ncbi:MAG: hypothetical protein IJ688_03080 [Treponema sp.]|nr:hypothetical protein [Treponema sp.]
MNDCDEYEIAGLNLSFKNNGKKRVSEFNIVFYLFDEEGEPVSLFRSNLVLNVKTDISAGESEDFMLSLDSFFTYEPESDYYIDYVYISRIVYSDGSSWNDPFGLALY